MRKVLKGGVAALVLLFGGRATADSITNLQVVDGSAAPTATINYTNADGTGSNSAYVYADPQVSGGTTSPLFYCVDLWHDNYIGSSYTITPVASMSFTNSTYSDVDNRIGWLLTQDQSTADARGAVQLAIWDTVDNKGFSMSSGDSVLTADFNSLISFAGYNPDVSYAASFWAATHDPSNTLYQDLVSAPTTIAPSQVPAPEPSSLVLGALSVVVLMGANLRRSRR